jgi:hypothetical protein
MFRPINIISNFPTLSPVNNKDEFADYDVDAIIKSIDEGLRTAKKLNVDTDLFFNKKWITEYFRNLKEKEGFFHDRVMKNYFCFIPFNYILINYNGDLLPCLLLGGKGNIKNSPIKTERKKSDHIRRDLSKRKFFDVCNCCFDQANNNVRFSAICNPFINISLIKDLMKDVKSVNKRFTRK